MTTVCPHCNHLRKEHDVAPEWQCPSCGVAYYKAVKKNSSGASWGRWLMFAAALYGLWVGAQVAQQRYGSTLDLNRLSLAPAAELSAAEIQSLATTVTAEDVLIYTTSSCTYCAQAKGWLNQYGFAYTECNMDNDKRCERDFLRYGGDGTPYLVVRGQHMKNGFDAQEFLALLRR